MSNSLQQHGMREAGKQLRLRMKNSGLQPIRVEASRKAGKVKFDFVGTPEQVLKAHEIVANWD